MQITCQVKVNKSYAAQKKEKYYKSIRYNKPLKKKVYVKKIIFPEKTKKSFLTNNFIIKLKLRTELSKTLVLHLNQSIKPL